LPIFIYDPRKGEKIRERLSLVGNSAQKEDWWTPPQGVKPLTLSILPAAKDSSPSNSTTTASHR